MSATELCWRRVGVWGDLSCPELGDLGHCHNCDRFSLAGQRLLHREIPEDYYKGAESEFPAPATTSRREVLTFLVFRIQREYYGLPASSIIEIVDRRRVHTLPHAHSSIVKGLVNIRGELLVCFSLSRLLRLEARTEEARSKHTTFERLLVTQGDSGRFVIPVSEVDGLHRVAVGLMTGAPATVARSSAPFTDSIIDWNPASRKVESGRHSVQVSLLNPGRLFRAFSEHLR